MVFIVDFLGCRPSFRGSARGESSVCVEINILFPAMYHWTNHHDRFSPEDAIPFLFLVIVSCIQDVFYYHFSPVLLHLSLLLMHHHFCRRRVSACQHSTCQTLV